MKVQNETAEHRRKFVAGDNDEARKTATGHSCKTLDRQTPKNKVYKDKALPSGQIAKSNHNYLIRIL